MINRNILKTSGLLAATLLIAPTQAQLPVGLKTVTAPPEDVVISARPNPSPQEVERQAKAISRMTDYYTEPLARFEDPICPGIMGLPVEVAALMIDRIRADAERVGARVATAAECKANVIVAFVRDGAVSVPKLMKTSAYLFNGLSSAETREIEKETGPVRAWHLTELRTRHGEAQTPSLSQAVQFSDNPGIAAMPTITERSSDSRVFLAGRRDIAYAVVVINISAIDGVPVAPIADYAAMRALAQTRPAVGDSDATTILSLFDPSGHHPLEMTRFDAAYLTSLYDAGSNLPASAKIGGVAREMRKEDARMMKVSAPEK